MLLPTVDDPQPAPAASQRPVPIPRYGIPSPGSAITRHQQGFKQFTRPVFPSPVVPWMEQGALGLSPELRTPPAHHRRRTSGQGQATKHEPGTTLSTSAEPPIHVFTHNVRPRVAIATCSGPAFDVGPVQMSTLSSRAMPSKDHVALPSAPVAVRWGYAVTGGAGVRP